MGWFGKAAKVLGPKERQCLKRPKKILEMLSGSVVAADFWEGNQLLQCLIVFSWDLAGTRI